MPKQLDRHMQQPCRREAVQQQLLPQSLQPLLLLPTVTASSALQLQVSPVNIVSDAPSFKTGVLTEACTIIDAQLLQFAFSNLMRNLRAQNKSSKSLQADTRANLAVLALICLVDVQLPRQLHLDPLQQPAQMPRLWPHALLALSLLQVSPVVPLCTSVCSCRVTLCRALL